MRVLFLNQYFPPDPAPTGLLFAEIGRALEARGHEVVLADSRQDYHAHGRQRRRLAREMRAAVALFFKALRGPRPDVLVSGSSPPCLIVAAAVAARMRGARSVHWAMDLYPELAVALGEIREGVVSKGIRRLMGAAYRRADAVVAVSEDMRDVLRGYGIEAVTVHPWVVGAARLEGPAPTAECGVWLYSGNLGRAHEWETLIEAQAILERRGVPATLRFQGGGAARPAAMARATAMGLKRCEWRDYAPAETLQRSLLEAQVLVATQRPETKGLLWPSKLALLRATARPLLWVGDVNGEVGETLRRETGDAAFSPGAAVSVADWIEARIGQPVPDGGIDGKRLERERETAIATWVALIERYP